MDEKWIDILIAVIQVLVFIWDVVSFPIYYYIQQPWVRKEAERKCRCRSVKGLPEGPYRHENSFNPLQLQISNEANTLYEVFKLLSIRYNKSDDLCMGTREILGEEDEKQPNGRIFKKYIMGNYRWNTYVEILKRTDNFSRGMMDLLEGATNENVVIFAETRAEWIIAALACFRYNIPIVTLYANLGEEAIIHGINETEATLVITSHELLPKFKTLLSKTPRVKNIVYMEGFTKVSTKDFPDGPKISTFAGVERMGASITNKYNGNTIAKREDLAIIMYTSGSTGTPKGVMLSHNNLLSSLASFSRIVEVRADDLYLAFLPLAHVLELTAEFLCLLNGVPVGYSSPLTISDKSSKIKKGTQGDATILQPTFMAAVPLILDRIYKNVHDIVNSGGYFNKRLFEFAYQYKLSALKRGYSTPFTDFLVFRKISYLLGGKVRVMVTGGAPVSPDTHEFIRVCLCCPLLQGYGLTETAACATVMDLNDSSIGRVGAPMVCCELFLEDWEEGNYRATDRPFPRGEIVLGGDNVSLGYYKLPGKTNEDFFMQDGKRWFRTGDIGEIHADGCIKIIDRKKDLVKLQFGEYVSLGKVESELKIVNLIENICVYGDSTKSYTVALITPNAKHLEELGKKLGKGNKSFTELCNDEDVEKAVELMLAEQGKKVRLQKFEIPLRVKLVPETWLPDSGLVTAAYKLKRKNIQDHYQDEIDHMYMTKGPGP